MKNYLLISILLIFALIQACTPKKIVADKMTEPPRQEIPAIIENTTGQSGMARGQEEPPRNKIPFTESIRSKIELSDNADIKRVQYYISKSITLTRTDEDEDVSISDEGTLIITDIKEEKEFVIPVDLKGSCICDSITIDAMPEGEILVTFSESDKRFLTFRSEPNNNGIYHLVADWDERGYGTVKYGDKDYTILPGAKDAQLLFSIKRISDHNPRRVTEDGRDVNNNKH
ncbi:MAG: hypothetical protein AAF696_22120 [Bacteroidota bacterium]